MSYFVIVPQGYGVLGKNSQMDYSSSPARVVSLDCEMQLLPEDDLVIGGDCYLASASLQKQLVEHGLTGFTSKNCIVRESDQFWILYDRRSVTIGSYTWMVISGEPFKADFGEYRGRLIISERAKELPIGCKLAEIVPFEEFAFDWETRKHELIARARERLRKDRLDKPQTL